MWAQTTPKGQYWRCSTLTAGHAIIRDDHALQKTIQLICHSLQHIDTIPIPVPVDTSTNLQAEIDNLKSKRSRLLDLYQDGSISKNDILDRITKLDDQIAALASELDTWNLKREHALAARSQLTQLAQALETLPRYLHTAPAKQINAELHGILQHITVGTDKTLTLVWK